MPPPPLLLLRMPLGAAWLGGWAASDDGREVQVWCLAAGGQGSTRRQRDRHTKGDKKRWSGF